MVAIAIIALLTAIIMTNFSSSKTRARDSQRISDLAQIQLALSLFYDRCNQFPTSISNPPTNDIGKNCPSGITLGSYIGKIPTQPSTDTTYGYVIDNTTSPTDYVLHAQLESANPSATANGLTSINLAYTNFVPLSQTFTCNLTTDYCVGPK